MGDVMEKVNNDQVIFDAICAATSCENPITVDTKKFIEAFNNHKDRSLCKSLNIGPEMCEEGDHQAGSNSDKCFACFIYNNKELEE